MIVVPTLDTPVLIDKAIAEINTKLMTLPWLTQAFGKIERLIEYGTARDVEIKRSRRGRRFPAIYKGDNQYEKMFPDEHKGNFSYIESDYEELEDYSGMYLHSTTIGIIFWFRYDTVFIDGDVNSIENVKKQVLIKLSETRLDLTVTRIDEQADLVYKDYHHEEIKQQHLMRPYGGFKVMCNLKYKELCG